MNFMMYVGVCVWEEGWTKLHLYLESDDPTKASKDYILAFNDFDSFIPIVIFILCHRGIQYSLMKNSEKLLSKISFYLKCFNKFLMMQLWEVNLKKTSNHE
jgi:hypothetical protein